MRPHAAWTAGAILLGAAMTLHAADAQKILAAQRLRIESADYRVTGRLVRVETNGARTTDDLVLRAHSFAGVLRVRVDVTSPAAAREHILLTMRRDGQSSIEIARPGGRTATSLPFDKWSSGPLGEGFSYEDFLEPEYFWPAQTVDGQTKFGARTCDVVVSRPGAEDRTHYAAVKTWLDAAIGFPVYAEKTLKGSATVKEFTYFGLRHEEGVWSASQIEEKTQGRGGSTLLIIDRGSARAHLTLKDFSPEQLTHF